LTNITVEDLIEAGAHFGHRTSRWNPAMAPYIFKKRNLIHIIDLEHTLRGLFTAQRVAEAIASKGEYVLFVGTKRQAQNIIRREAERCGMPYAVERWPGGLLTNYVTIRQRLKRLEELEDLERTGKINDYSKKMISSFRRERRKIERNLGGVRDMERLPGLLVVVDPTREDIAVREAVKLNIPVVAWIDTDGDPVPLDVVAPANDDSIGSIEIFARSIADAVIKGVENAKVSSQTEDTPEKKIQGEGESQTEPNESDDTDDKEKEAVDSDSGADVDVEGSPEAPENTEEEEATK
jgi:small subunit ribosomal protein S2